MANTVKLFWRPNLKFELEINSLICKDDFTSAGFDGVLSEVDTFLASDDGQARLSGSYQLEADQTITYVNLTDSTEFDGTNNYNITFIDQRP